MTLSYDPRAARRATNLSVNTDLLRQAREAGLNLSQTLESALIDRLTELESERWRRDNAEAIETYNARVTSTGVFGARHKRF